MAFVAPEAAARRVQVRVIADSPTGQVAGDEVRVRQLVTTVLSTAIASARAGSSLAVTLARPTDSSVCLTVQRGDVPSLAARGGPCASPASGATASASA